MSNRGFWHIQGVRGLFRQSLDIAQEKTLPNFLAEAKNIVLDLHGNAYVMTGYTSVYTAAAAVKNLFYSATLDRLVFFVASTGAIILLNPDTLTADTLAAAFPANSTLTYADWPLTRRCYVSDGVSYKYIDTVPSLNVVAGQPGTLLYVHKNTMFVKRPEATRKVEVQPSAQDDPDTFTAADALKFTDDGNDITAFFELNGTFCVATPSTIYAVSGDAFAGSAKNPVKQNLKTGRGPIRQEAVLVEDNIAYFVGYDGFYRFNGESLDKISTPFDAILMELWPLTFTDTHFVGLFNPTWGQASGKQFIIFGITGLGQNYYFLFDIHTGDWIQWSDFDAATAMVHAPKYARTYFIADDEIMRLDNVGTNAGNAINASLELNPIDGGVRTVEKRLHTLHMYPMNTDEAKAYAGVNGIYPTVPLTFDANQSAMELPEQLVGHLHHFRFESEGGGGAPVFAGCSVGLSYVPEKKKRSFLFSRAEYLDWVMANHPLIAKGQETLAGGETTLTIAHGLNGVPIAAYACHEGWTMAKVLTVTQIDDTNIVVTFPAAAGHGAGDKVHWVAILPTNYFVDSYLRGRPIQCKSAAYHNHSLNITPGAILINKEGSDTKGLSVSDVNSKSVKMTLEAGHSNDLGQIIAVKQGTRDTWFKAGLASASPVTHGYSAAPDAVLLFPNQSPLPTWGIDSVGATTFAYTGSGDFYWMAVKF